MTTHFPHPTNPTAKYAGAYALQDVRLDGQRVLFDKKVRLLPVALQARNP